MVQWYKCVCCNHKAEGDRYKLDGVRCEKCNGGPFMPCENSPAPEDSLCIGCGIVMEPGPRKICRVCSITKRRHSTGELTLDIEVASWYNTLTDAMVGAITTAAHAGMPEDVAYQVMKAAMSAALPEAVVVSKKDKKEKNIPPPQKI